VVLPHDFFAWFASHIFRDATTHRGFVVFWGYSWFAIVKGWHAAEFAILCALALMIFNRLAPSRPRRNVVAAMILCLLFALSDEYHQTFVPGRRGSWADVAIDGLGVGLAGTFAWARARRRASGVSRVP
jgi:VanZ family protein